jgi:hypothetical protein
MTKSSIERSVVIFVVALVIAFIWTLTRVFMMVGWL